jgi:large subunit ribosomal protein L4
MTAVDVRTPAGETVGSVELPAEIFDAQVNIPLIHQVVVGQLAAARQGTHSTKTRGEVSGGGKKPYRQKGTGRARQGSTRAPQFTGGGVVHGPTPRDHSQRTPKKMKAAALRGALSDRARGGRVHVLTAVVDGSAPSTKAAALALAQVSDRPRLLVVVERSDLVTWKSLRNVDRAHVIVPDQLNTYDVLVSDDVIFTQAALETFLSGPTRGKGAKAVAVDYDAEAPEVADVEVAPVEVEEPEVAAVEVEEPAVAAAEEPAAAELAAEEPELAAVEVEESAVEEPAVAAVEVEESAAEESELESPKATKTETGSES